MLSVESLTVGFGSKPLFSNVGFVINNHERIALVGKNGAGKSTLLKVISGLQEPISGKISHPSDFTIGYLPQVMKLNDGYTLWCDVERVFKKNIELKAKIRALEEEMNRRSDNNSEQYLQLVEEYSNLSDQYTISGADGYEAQIERTLMGLGFERSDFHRPTSELSGGWRMRVELAKILLKKPNLLLLDEPTNHLDIESILWLEKFLSTSGAAVMVVSHDKAFINNVTSRTIEISCGKIIDYNVPYNSYLTLRKERIEQQQRAFENQQKEIADIKDFIERFRYKPTKAVQVQSRIKQLEKIVPIEVDEVDRKKIHLKFLPCERSGDFPVICKDVAKSYGSHNVLSGVNLTLRRGEKIAFVGRNGEGKSTLVKCIMNEIDYEGELKIGHNVKIGYFAQNQAQRLNDEISVYDTIDNVARGEMRLRINDILGAFMFGGEASEKPVKVLSGGERSRLAIIRLLLEPVNLLILDEPTNHLDIESKEVLKEAIKVFEGTVIIVSHDRDFLDGLVSKVYEFSNGKVKENIGDVYDFLRHHKLESLNGLDNLVNKKDNQSGAAKKGLDDDKNRKINTDSKVSYLEQKEKKKKISKIEKKISALESEIEECENKLSELDNLLMNPENSSNITIVEEYSSVKNKMDKLISDWEIENENLDNLKNEI